MTQDERAEQAGQADEFVWTPDEVKGIRGAWLRYRVMAYLVGTLLVVLVLVGLPMKYLGDNDLVVRLTGIPHGWLYMVLLITAFDLGRRVQWSWKRLLLIMAAGTVPFLSFVAERSASHDVRDKLAAATVVSDEDLSDDAVGNASA